MFRMSGFSGSEIRRLADFLTVVIVSSPCSSHPETTLIEKAILSLSRFSCLDQCPIVIVLDGYIIRESSRTKKGQITGDMSIQYDAYHQRLSALYGDNDQIRIRRSEKHLGFALAVKFGLSFCTTTYAMIAQHDRIFLNSFHRLQDLIDVMESNDHIRYIGFPTVANRTHDSVLNSRYRVSYLDSSDVKMSLGENLYLQPLIFWFDSQHLCHIQRYLQIYKPFLTLPEEMKEWLGTKAVNDMVLRVGDFIEDRFGQSQRNCLTTKGRCSFFFIIHILHSKKIQKYTSPNIGISSEFLFPKSYIYLLGKSDTFMLAAFRWFGTYLAWVPDDKAKSSRDGRGDVIHLVSFLSSIIIISFSFLNSRS